MEWTCICLENKSTRAGTGLSIYSFSAGEDSEVLCCNGGVITQNSSLTKVWVNEQDKVSSSTNSLSLHWAALWTLKQSLGLFGFNFY